MFKFVSFNFQQFACGQKFIKSNYLNALNSAVNDIQFIIMPENNSLMPYNILKVAGSGRYESYLTMCNNPGFCFIISRILLYLFCLRTSSINSSN